jgi:signal transduction histidine kinase
VRRRLVLSYVTITAVILLALEVPLGLVYARHEHDVSDAGVTRDAAALASLAEEGVEHPGGLSLAAVAGHYRTSGEGDVEIVDRHGAVLVAPVREASAITASAVRSQLAAVLKGGPGGVRLVPHLDDVLAIEPIGSADSPSGAVIVAASDKRVDRRVHAAWLALAALAAGVLAAVAVLGLLVARSVTGPLTHLESAARRLGSGDLSARAPATTGPSEVRALSREFNGMAGRLEDLVAAQRAFVADASHQLRSPLTALRLRLENVVAAIPRGDADMEAMLGELDRLSRVVDGLLVLARSEGQRPERTTVDVTAVVADRCDAWSALADEAGVSLDSEPAGGPAISAWLVAGHLEQILDNLLANALEATPAGRSVRVSVRRDGDQVEVHVTDEGRGMGEQERLHAFDRFWRGSTSRPEGGSGLGLAIVRQLARISGADVELREGAGGGVDAVVRMAASRSASLRPGVTRRAVGAGPDGGAAAGSGAALPAGGAARGGHQA